MHKGAWRSFRIISAGAFRKHSGSVAGMRGEVKISWCLGMGTKIVSNRLENNGVLFLSFFLLFFENFRGSKNISEEGRLIC